MATKKITTKDADKKEKVATPSILLRPRVTEKAAIASQLNTYLFDVAVDATKSEIAKAFFKQYKTKPVSVNVLNVKPKTYFLRGKLGIGRRGRKAYIKVPKGAKIDIA